MDAEQNDNPQLPDALGSTEYRTRLTTKLNCLIAVLEVAIAKITKNELETIDFDELSRRLSDS